MTYVSTKGMSRAEWLAARKRGIGGSDAPHTILTKEDWSFADPGRLYRDKLGLLTPAEIAADEASGRRKKEVGSWCEELVARYFTEATGMRVERSNKMYISKKHPFMLADIDRKIVGKKIGLECKAVSYAHWRDYSELKEDGKPTYKYIFADDPMEMFLRKKQWYFQVQHYMATLGWEEWYLAVLVFLEYGDDYDFKYYHVTRDEDDIAALVDAEESFWGHVTERYDVWNQI